LLPRLLVRPQPQGHAGADQGPEGWVLASAGADLAQRAWRLAHRRRSWRPELPDRPPLVPAHAPAQPAPGPAADRQVLRRARRAVRRIESARLLRSGPPSPEPGRPPDPAPPGHHCPSNGGSSVRLVITASGSAAA